MSGQRPLANSGGEVAGATPARTVRCGLTRREQQVAALIARGRTSREIAEVLVISERTADAHAEHIRDKLGLRSRTEIAAWAVKLGLLDTSFGARGSQAL